MGSETYKKTGITLIILSSVFIITSFFFTLSYLRNIKTETNQLTLFSNEFIDKINKLFLKVDNIEVSLETSQENSVLHIEQLNDLHISLDELELSLAQFREQNGVLFHSVTNRINSIESRVADLKTFENSSRESFQIASPGDEQSQLDPDREKEKALDALQRNPNDIDSLFTLGSHYFEAGDLQAAASYYEKIIELDPGNLESYQVLGRISLREKDYARAVYIYSRLTRMDQGNALNYLKLATGLYNSERIDEARDVIEKALDLDSTSPIILNMAGMIFHQAGRIEQAVTCLLDSLEISDDPKTLSFLGEIYEERGEYNHALEYWNQVIESYERNNLFGSEDLLETYVKLARIAYIREDFRKIDFYFHRTEEIGWCEEIHFLYLRSLKQRNLNQILSESIAEFEKRFPLSIYNSELVSIKTWINGA